MTSQWHNPIYQQTILTVLGIIFISAIPVYFLRKKNFYFIVAWASLKSWLILAPIFLLLLGAPSPWPHILLTFLALLGIKVFFQLMGIFHRTFFVTVTYIAAVMLSYFAYKNELNSYNVVPMILLGMLCLIPVIQNTYTNMLQYISLSLINFLFMGWSFLHLALILHLEDGFYQLMYLVILTEFCDNTNLATAHYFPKSKKFDKVMIRRTWGSTILAVVATVMLAFAMRHLLPIRSEIFWLTAGLIASLVGGLGDIVLSILRRDIGIKVLGPFIMGRGDFLSRMHRLIFVAPIYYYAMRFLLGLK